VTVIDRGGAAAPLYGTWALLPRADRGLIAGFVLNKFRGDASLLAPAPQRLQALTGVPTVATLPMLRRHGLPEEDSLFDHSDEATSAEVTRTIDQVLDGLADHIDAHFEAGVLRSLIA
jgi:adenosylcobyric acid synthase